VISNGTSGLFEYIRNQVINAGTATAPDVATGALIASPGLAGIVGHAYAFSYPGGAATFLPTLFSYSYTVPPTSTAYVNTVPYYPTNSLSTATNLPARAAAITAGVLDGVIEAEGFQYGNTPTATQLTAGTTDIKATVTAAVKAALLLTDASVSISTPTGSVADNGPAAVMTAYLSQAYNPVPGTEDIVDSSPTNATISAILTAVAKTAGKTYVLTMAQAAAQAAAEVYDFYNGATVFSGTAYAGIVSAFEAATSTFTGSGVPTNPQVVAAVAAGVTAAENSTTGFGAAGVVNYATRPVTGSFVTSIYEL
jgi:hypothetical protein